MLTLYVRGRPLCRGSGHSECYSVLSRGVLRKRLLPVPWRSTNNSQPMTAPAVMESMAVTAIRLPKNWKQALAARGQLQGNDLSTQVRLAVFAYIEREGIQA